MATADIHRTIDTVWRIESAKIIASLAHIVGEVGLAEELAQDALVIDLEKWPEAVIPDNPGAWLMATAKHRAIDPAAGLEIVDSLTAETSLKNYQHLPSVRGYLLAKLGRYDKARVEFERAAILTRNTRVRELLIESAQSCLPARSPTPGLHTDLPAG
jgi:predicted RNA polymerase sigma factor